MYFKQKNNILFRNYGSFGYITDNRNFSYKLTNHNEDYIGDKILSESGAGWQGFIVGNIKETPLNDIWNNSEKVQYLRNLKNKDFPKCILCTDKEYCTMCMVRNANENISGNPLVVSEYFCNIAKLNKEVSIEWKNKNT